jgi:hypothetical protein
MVASKQCCSIRRSSSNYEPYLVGFRQRQEKIDKRLVVNSEFGDSTRICRKRAAACQIKRGHTVTSSPWQINRLVPAPSAVHETMHQYKVMPDNHFVLQLNKAQQLLII